MARLRAPQERHFREPPLLVHSFCAPVTNYKCFSFLYHIKQEYSGPLNISKVALQQGVFPRRAFKDCTLWCPVRKYLRDLLN